MRKMVVLYCNIENNLRAIGAQNPFLPLDFFKALYSADTALRLMAYRIVDLANNAHLYVRISLLYLACLKEWWDIARSWVPSGLSLFADGLACRSR